VYLSALFLRLLCYMPTYFFFILLFGLKYSLVVEFYRTTRNTENGEDAIPECATACPYVVVLTQRNETYQCTNRHARKAQSLGAHAHTRATFCTVINTARRTCTQSRGEKQKTRTGRSARLRLEPKSINKNLTVTLFACHHEFVWVRIRGVIVIIVLYATGPDEWP
jgi:hypothetical protein